MTFPDRSGGGMGGLYAVMLLACIGGLAVFCWIIVADQATLRHEQDRDRAWRHGIEETRNLGIRAAFTRV